MFSLLVLCIASLFCCTCELWWFAGLRCLRFGFAGFVMVAVFVWWVCWVCCLLLLCCCLFDVFVGLTLCFVFC